jgi:ADP-ribose pyrophosphatase YjhB (NUDIX family)
VRQLARPVAVAILRRDDRILVFRVPDPVKHVIGYRPAGGTIEFGEAGADTVVREIREELGVEVIEPRYLGTLENIFTYLGKTGHELVRVYEVRFADSSLYGRDEFACVEANGEPFTCVWKPLKDFDRDPLYPTGLLALLRG